MSTEAVEPARPKMNSTLGRKMAATRAVTAQHRVVYNANVLVTRMWLCDSGTVKAVKLRTILGIRLHDGIIRAWDASIQHKQQQHSNML